MKIMPNGEKKSEEQEEFFSIEELADLFVLEVSSFEEEVPNLDLTGRDPSSPDYQKAEQRIQKVRGMVAEISDELFGDTTKDQTKREFFFDFANNAVGKRTMRKRLIKLYNFAKEGDRTNLMDGIREIYEKLKSDFEEKISKRTYGDKKVAETQAETSTRVGLAMDWEHLKKLGYSQADYDRLVREGKVAWPLHGAKRKGKGGKDEAA